jgi:hypothetical protein
MHSALNLNYGDDLSALSDQKLDEARVNLGDLKVLIIDEVSMVKADQLYQIHVRLSEIFQVKSLFG